MLGAAMIGLQSAKAQTWRRCDLLSQHHGGRSRRYATAPGPDIDLHQHRQFNPGRHCSSANRHDLRRIIGAHANARNPRQGCKTRELASTHHLVAHQNIVNPAPGQHLRLGHLLHALPNSPTRHLQPGDHRRFMRLGMCPQFQPGLSHQPGHHIQIGFERIQIDHQSRRVDLILSHAGLGGGGLQHHESPSADSFTARRKKRHPSCEGVGIHP